MHMKGELKIKRKRKSTEETVTFDPRLSQDKKTFVLVIESSTPMTWFESVQAALVYAKDELDRLGLEASATAH
jgi:hypothetical protein